MRCKARALSRRTPFFHTLCRSAGLPRHRISSAGPRACAWIEVRAAAARPAPVKRGAIGRVAGALAPTVTAATRGRVAPGHAARFSSGSKDRKTHIRTRPRAGSSRGGRGANGNAGPMGTPRLPSRRLGRRPSHRSYRPQSRPRPQTLGPAFWPHSKPNSSHGSDLIGLYA